MPLECMAKCPHPVTLQVLDFIDDSDEMKPTGQTVTRDHDECTDDEDHDGPHRGFFSEWSR